MCSPKSTLNAAILSLSQSLNSPLVVGAQVDVFVSVTVNTDQSGSLVNIGNNDKKNSNNSKSGNTSNDNKNNLGKGISWKLHLAGYAPCVHAWAAWGGQKAWPASRVTG